MDLSRRSFLGALMGLAAAPVLARLKPPELILPPAQLKLIKPEPVLLPTLVPVGVGNVLALRAFARDAPGVWPAMENVQACRLLRADGAVLMQRLVAVGMFLTIEFCAEQSIRFTVENPLVLDVPEDMCFDMTYCDERGVLWYRVIDGRVTEVLQPLGSSHAFAV